MRETVGTGAGAVVNNGTGIDVGNGKIAGTEAGRAGSLFLALALGFGAGRFLGWFLALTILAFLGTGTALFLEGFLNLSCRSTLAT